MARSRDAVDTIKGYYYQFDYFIFQLISLVNEEDTVTIEGIEDVDILEEKEMVAVQCKYYAKTEYNHSVIAKPIRLMLKDYVNRTPEKRKIRYKLYGKYQSGQDKYPGMLTVEFAKKNLFTYTEKKVVHVLHEILMYIKNRNNEKKDKNNNIPYKTADGETHNFDTKKVECLFEEEVEYTGTSASGTNNGSLINFIDRLENKINDKRLEFLFGEASKKISFEETLRELLGYQEEAKSNITILDLSGVPFDVLSITVSLISRILFEFGYYYKRMRAENSTGEGAVINDVPVLLVYEEAHKYVPNNDMAKYRASRESIERIAKEGRKYGISLMLASQRPSEISETIFSQCNNFLSLRLTNPADQNYVKRLLPDTLGSIVDKMPVLKAGECLLIGDAVILPSIVQIEECDLKPSSTDIPYLQLWKEEWHSLDVEAIKKAWKR